MDGYLVIRIHGIPMVGLRIEESGMLSLVCEPGTPESLVRYLFAGIDRTFNRSVADVNIYRIVQFVSSELLELAAAGKLYRNSEDTFWVLETEDEPAMDDEDIYVGEYHLLPSNLKLEVN